ncbi:MAG: 50S ribosomal protein L32 [Candidatus Omnitrophica bacterium CG11_big_fil_rev_8_21_14_0_20_45_26]|uniref:Large ribosomal subunit protein bL32 n=1 Tax=Candidatus Abzuiibacterium crystallinum TaxID=1974748 RepID=A0A2H0LS87_9BACT|nr:MAG: 50S ribosomal protein L32 [Candidatus Omnitrophica bacterium CG11_big_fil_rev_8_21_14_0_20_45_26]PIW65042.1 MAG: 50S ribosomal protein L32 [Candidatus Omnitrophica bacterium CG12_big_fil_rev_8_21_14_0_65_45_16]
MAHPKRRHSNERSSLRRSHDAVHAKSLSKCSNCGAMIAPHRICPACGYYKGRQVVTIKMKSKSEK